MTPLALKDIHPNEAKFLKLLTKTEGTDRDGKPYNCLFSHKYFTNFHTHPNIKIAANGIQSTAAGRYQILYKTFLDLKMKDFTPESQDRAAIKLIIRRKAHSAVLNGDWKEAIRLCGNEWASLPGSKYGQPTAKLADCLTFLKTA